MALHKLAGKPAPRSLLVNIPRLVTSYYTRKPDVTDPAQKVAFGTSGHRGSSFKNSFNEDHILAICQAICQFRKSKNVTGPLFMGMDTHALSEPALASALEGFGLDIEVVNEAIDPTFGFMTVDKDGKIRMDCSSPYAMASLIGLKDNFDIAFGNDPDTDRHGIVTRGSGLLNPNHYLAVAVWYLFQNRPNWKPDAAVGKTLVSSSMIDRVAAYLNRKLSEVPVGFKWFVDGLLDGSYGFGGEESAGASFLRKDGTVWTTDKDGIIMNLLAAEITAKTARDPGELYKDLEARFGKPVYERTDAPATSGQKSVLKRLSPDMVVAKELAGEKITAKLTHASGNGAPIGGLKVVAENGWFAARPSGTEDIYKIYAESFKGKEHLKKIQEEAQAIVNAAFKAAGA